MNVMIRKNNIPSFVICETEMGLFQLFGTCEISRFQHVKYYFNIELQAVNSVFPKPFSKEEHVK